MFGRAKELGINLIDTAECYGDHTSESLVGKAVAKDREQWIIATKFGHKFHSNFERTEQWSPREVLQQREGDRHPIRFRIVVRGRNNRGERFTEETETELVSRRGARLVSSHAVASGETIELSTPFHSRALTATVTACYRGADNRMRIGFKLVDPPRWGA